MKSAVNVQQNSTTTGTGDLTLDAAATGFRAFSDAVNLKPASGFQSDPHFVPYYIESGDGSEWEFGAAEVQDDSGNGALARTGTGAVVFESSNSGSLVNFTSGDKAVRLITPPDLRDLARGCALTSSSDSMADGATVSWSSETSDTDNCWTPGDPTLLYIPLWAQEVEIEYDISYFATAATDQPIALKIESFSCQDADRYAGGVLQNSSNYLTYITGVTRFVVNGSSVNGNPIGDGSRASLRFKFYNPDGIAVSTQDALVKMRVIR